MIKNKGIKILSKKFIDLKELKVLDLSNNLFDDDGLYKFIIHLYNLENLNELHIKSILIYILDITIKDDKCIERIRIVKPKLIINT